jgi:hypothetical protein
MLPQGRSVELGGSAVTSPKELSVLGKDRGPIVLWTSRAPCSWGLHLQHTGPNSYLTTHTPSRFHLGPPQ